MWTVSNVAKSAAIQPCLQPSHLFVNNRPLIIWLLLSSQTNCSDVGSSRGGGIQLSCRKTNAMQLNNIELKWGCPSWITFYAVIFLYMWSVATRWRSRLRHCSTSRKVAVSIPDCVTGISHWHNPSGRTMALDSTHPLTEMSTRNISWGVKAAGAQGWQPYNLHVPIVLKSGSLNLPGTLWASPGL
jgi:hypothetical protein